MPFLASRKIVFIISVSIRSCARRTASRPLPRASARRRKSTPTLRPMVVATAAPVTPSRGNGPMPNTNSGPSRMLIPLASQSARMLIAASPRAAEGGVDQEQQQDADVAGQHEAGVARADRHHGRRGAHRPEERRRQQTAADADHRRQPEADEDRLRGGARGAFTVLGAGSARHHRAHAHRHPHADGVDDGEQALRQPDGGDRVGPQLRDPEVVGDGEDRLHHHLEHHRDGQEGDGAPEWHGGQNRGASPRALRARAARTAPVAGRRRILLLVRSARWTCWLSLRCCRPEEPQIVTDDPQPFRPGSSFDFARVLPRAGPGRYRRK